MTILAKMEPSQIVMLAAGVAILAFVFMRMSRQRWARSNRSAPSPTEQRSAIQSAGHVRDQLDELMAQLEELARSTAAQIETRTTKLEILLRDADQKIARLESLLATAEGKSHSEKPRPTNGGDAIKPEQRRIYELADAGRSPVEIAREVGRDTGEVELILALRKKG